MAERSSSARLRTIAAVVVGLVGSAEVARAGEAAVAVAANFLFPLEALHESFQKAGGHRLKISAGNTTNLYSLIRNGAPFDVFLSADEKHPRLLETEGLGVAGTGFAYAVGVLVLWSADEDLIGPDGREALRQQKYRKLAIVNPDLAPYGAAAREVLQGLGLWEALLGKLVQGQTVLQVHQWVATGNAELGFVALSQLATPGAHTGGSKWVVPTASHAPIRHGAVLLARGRDNDAARSFHAYLRSTPAIEIIRAFGYELP